MICVVRMGSDERTRRYVARRTAEGKNKWEIMRCLKRYIAREVYRVLLSPAAAEPPPSGITKTRLGSKHRVGLDYKSVTESTDPTRRGR
jgi:transposase